MRVLLFPALLPLFWREMQVRQPAGCGALAAPEVLLEGCGGCSPGEVAGWEARCRCTGLHARLRGACAPASRAEHGVAPPPAAPQNGYAWWETAAVMTTQVGRVSHRLLALPVCKG